VNPVYNLKCLKQAISAIGTALSRLTRLSN
jgi:hypothetical protein